MSDLVRRQLSPHVFAAEQQRKGLGWSNSGLVAAGGGLVVDTLYDLALTRRLAQLYAEVHPEPPRRVVNTHHNGDHCWGNQIFRGAEILAHAGCARRFAEFPPSAAEAIRTLADPPAALRGFQAGFAHFRFDDIELVPPTTVLEGDATLDLGGLRVDLLWVGPAHTEGDLVVHVPEEGVVLAGDVLFHRCTPLGWEGSTQRWIDALLRIEALAPEHVVPGHGPVCGVEGVRSARAYFEDVRRFAQDCHRRGLSVLECCAKLDLGPYAGWDEPWRLAATVHRIYRECTGAAWDAPFDLGAVMADVAELEQRMSA